MDTVAFLAGAHAQISGLASKPELNEQHCVSLGPSPDNPERVTIVTSTGAQISVRPSNLRPAELLPGSHVAVVGLTGAAKYNGSHGEVHSWHGDRWIVDLDSNERKSFRATNLVILPAAVGGARKRKADEPEVEAKRAKLSDIKELESCDESVVALALARLIHEFPIIAQKCICCLATKGTVTVVHELGLHLTNKQSDGLLRRELKPGDKVKGIEEMDALEQCTVIAERRMRTLAGMCRLNRCDLLGFIKQGFKEPKFNRKLHANPN